MAKKVDQETISEVMRELGRRGGEAKVAKGFSTMTAARRKEIAKAAAAKRWGKKTKGKSK